MTNKIFQFLNQINQLHQVKKLIRQYFLSFVFFSIITSNISVLVEHGLGEEGRDNFRLVHDSCAVIQKIGNAKSSVDVGPYRLNEDHELFVRLEELLYDGVDEMKDDAYVPMSQQAVAVIFQVTTGQIRETKTRNLIHFVFKKQRLTTLVLSQNF